MNRITSAACAALFLLMLTATAISQATWAVEAPATSPSNRAEMGYCDSALFGGPLIFGGRNGATYFNDTYAYVGGAWTLMPTATSPSIRTTRMVYDSFRGVHVVYGGASPASPFPLADTWEYDGVDWTLITTPGNPGPKFQTAMSFDTVTNQTVLFSGAGMFSIYPTDTWLYNGTNWTMQPTSTPPQGRRGHAMVYDQARGKHVMFGGESSLLQIFNDTWEFDTGTLQWQQVFTVNAPSPRTLPSMTYDPIRQVTILFGGFDSSFQPLSDTWEFDGTDWTQNTSPANPLARAGAAFVANAQTGIGTLFGGATGPTAIGDTWSYVPPALSMFPGNGGDVGIQVRVNGVLQSAATGVYPITSTDTFQLNMLSPLGSLDFQGFALIGSPYATASPLPGIPLLGAPNPLDVWIDPNFAVVFLDGLAAPTGLFAPLLVPGGFPFGPFLGAAGTVGTSVNIQAFANSPGLNPVNLAVSDTAVLQFM